MFPGGGGMNDRKMQQMMKQMGIEMTEIDAEEIVITTPDEELVFSDAEVQRMNAQGQQTYTIVGEPESRPRGDGGAADAEGDDAEGADLDAATEADESGEADAGGAAPDIEDADVELVAQRAGVSEDDARAALEETDGDLAAAISRLE